MTTCAVTGATGHLGHHAVLTLLHRAGPAHDVVAVVRDAAKSKPLAVRGMQVRAADYADTQA